MKETTKTAELPRLLKPTHPNDWMKSGSKNALPDVSEKQIRATQEMAKVSEEIIALRAKDFLNRLDEYNLDILELATTPIKEMRPKFLQAIDAYWKKNIRGGGLTHEVESQRASYKVFVSAIIKEAMFMMSNIYEAGLSSGSMPWLKTDLPTEPPITRKH